jgi:HD-GYP domain-containing protein (c-di-GMP phosphodiesterase class II)
MENKKKISVSELKPGMFIDKLDISWLKSPFLRHRRKIENEQDILLYKQYGVKFVTIDLDKSTTIGTPDIAVEEKPNAVSDSKQQESNLEGTQAPGNKQEEHKTAVVLSFSQELKAAKAIKNKIQTFAKQLNQEIKNGQPINIEAVKPVIQETLDSLKRNDQALLTLLHMHRKDVRLNAHPFGVFSLVLPLALKTNLSTEHIEILGMAALLHDCGWARLPLNLFGKGKAYTINENKLIQQHPALAAHALCKTQGIPKAVISLVEQHHELPNGKGYPKKLFAEQLHPLLEYLQLADHYDEYIHGLGDKPAVLPVNALKLLYKESRAGFFSESLVTELVRILGIYPISSVVKLSTNELAIVCEVNRKVPLLPIINIFLDKIGNKITPPQLIDLNNDEHQRKIAEVMEPSAIDDDPHVILACL